MVTTGDRPAGVGRRAVDRTWLVALGSSIWGLDGLLRKPLAVAINPATVVLWEHLIVIVAVAPLIPRAIRVLRGISWTQRAAIALIGVGASAVATTMFTEAFKLSAKTNDFITPLVLQKLQPLFAVALAVVLLRERLRPTFALYAVPALAGAWLLAFGDPFHVQVAEAEPALLALGAAALWGMGTVLGRLVSSSVSPRDLTVLRYLGGGSAAVVICWLQGAPVSPGAGNLPGLIALALIPGLLALVLYYVGLRSTAASRATFAELAFPATAAIVGVVFQGSRLTGSQWLGFAIVVAAITALGWHERARTPAVIVSDDPESAIALTAADPGAS